MNTAEVEALFARALVGDYEADDAWEAVFALQRDGSREIFEHAAEWCIAGDPLKRARGADLLAQLRRAPAPGEEQDPRDTESMFRAEAYALITKMLEKEQDCLVLDSAIKGLGHLRDPSAAPLILRYQDHPDGDVRFAVAFALGCFPNDAQSVRGLLKLTSDSDADVRDWAVFGLGVLGDVDSPEIREALFRCLDDASQNVREEAAVGLAKRQDQRLIPKLLEMLDEPGLTIRLAEATADLLGLDKDPPDWTAADYKAALKKRFQIPE
jgi:HEAT repeat protein